MATLYYKISSSGPTRGRTPSDDPGLFANGQKISSYKYSSHADEKGDLYFTREIAGLSWTRPDDYTTAKYEEDHGDVDHSPYSAWSSLSVPDSFDIPWELDKSGLVGNFRFSSSLKTSIGVGPFTFGMASGNFGGVKLTDFVTSLVGSIPGALEYTFKALGFSGLATAIKNASAATTLLNGTYSDSIALLEKSIAASSDPNADLGALNGEFDAFAGRFEQRAGAAFDKVVLIPGNASADLAAHNVIKAAGLLGSSNVPTLGSATLQVDFTAFGATLSTSATAKVGYAIGGSGDYALKGQSAQNFLVAGDGANTLYAGTGRDYLHGGAGNDRLVAGSGSAFFNGGTGTDTFQVDATGQGTGISVDGAGRIHVISGPQDSTLDQIERIEFRDGSSSGTSSAGAIVEAYTSFMGRLPTGSELQVWSGAMGSGTTQTQLATTVAGASDAASLSRFIDAAYHDFFGRSAGASEQAVWQAAFRSGSASTTSFTSVLAGEALKQGRLEAFITDQYETYLDDAPTAAEVQTWTNLLMTGQFSQRQMGVILAAEPGAGSVAIGALYRDFMGRDATQAEYAYWIPVVSGGAQTLDQVQSILLNDAAGHAHTAVRIEQLYQSHLNRAAGSQEIAYWEGQLKAGGSWDELTGALAADPIAQNLLRSDAVVAELYLDYFGRAATADELKVWKGEVAKGIGFDQVRAILISAPEGGAYLGGIVEAEYRLHFGRDPGSDDLSVWLGLFAKGLKAADLIGALQGSSEFVSHLPRLIADVYEAWFDRNPTAGERSFWTQELTHGGTVQGLISAVASAGSAHAADAVREAFSLYSGRSPTTDELTLWSAKISAGFSPETLQAQLAATTQGEAYLRSKLYADYLKYVEHEPSAGEYAFWLADLREYGDYDRVIDALTTWPGANVDLMVGTSGKDDFLVYRAASGDPYHVNVIQDFDPSKDRILVGQDGGGLEDLHLDPLRDAWQVRNANGRYDVFVYLTELTIIEDMTVAELSEANFII